MQNKCCNKEINVLQNRSSEFPKLVKNLNLFRDSKGILRSRGCVGKCLELNYNSLNPLLMGKKHLFLF